MNEWRSQIVIYRILIWRTHNNYYCVSISKQNDGTRNEIDELVRQHDYEKLEKLLLTRLTFGTAGLRGAMRTGYNSMNDLVVIQSAQGLAKYVLQCFPNAEDRERGVVFGYDGRYNSKR